MNRLVIFDHQGGHGPKEISQKSFILDWKSAKISWKSVMDFFQP